MDQNIKELMDISHFYGVDEEYVIAGGGNTSYKSEDTLWIKASGVALANIGDNGFVKMSREKLQVISNNQYSSDSSTREAQVKEDLLKAVLVDNHGLRPSVETSLHEIVKYPFVIHTHPTLVNAVLCSNQAREKSFELFGNEILFLPYIDPGYVLFKHVSDALNEYRINHGRDPRIILLENHGIIVSGENTSDVKTLYTEIGQKIMKAAKKQLPELKDGSFQSKLMDDAKLYYGKDFVVNAVQNELIDPFVEDEESFKVIQTAFTPDHIVYCKARYLFIDESADFSAEVNAFKQKFGYLPKIIGVKSKGLMLIDDSEPAVHIIKLLILNMMKISYIAGSFGGSKPMTNNQIAFIENWEAENYRKKMAEKKK